MDAWICKLSQLASAHHEHEYTIVGEGAFYTVSNALTGTEIEFTLVLCWEKHVPSWCECTLDPECDVTACVEATYNVSMHVAFYAEVGPGETRRLQRDCLFVSAWARALDTLGPVIRKCGPCESQK